MTLLVFIYNIPRFFEYCIDHEWNGTTNTTRPRFRAAAFRMTFAYNIAYENVLYCLFVFLSPLAILVVLNTCLIRELLRSRRRLANVLVAPRSCSASSVQSPKAKPQNPPTTNSMTPRADNQEQNLTFVMIVIVIVYLVCQTPAYVNQLLYYVLDKKQHDCGMPYFYYYHVSNLVVSANSCVNFFVYCAFRRQFRQRIVVLCGRRWACLRSTSRDSWGLSEETASRGDVSMMSSSGRRWEATVAAASSSECAPCLTLLS